MDTQTAVFTILFLIIMCAVLTGLFFQSQKHNENLLIEVQGFEDRLVDFHRASLPIVTKIKQQGDMEEWANGPETSCIYTYAELESLVKEVEKAILEGLDTEYVHIDLNNGKAH